MAKILVVDDEDSLRELLREILEELGHVISTATNGEHALKIMEKEPPDLVISDVMMPIMDGYVLLEQIRIKRQWQTIKVMLVSAAEIKRQGPYKADEYMNKPFDLANLERVVERLIV